MANVEELCDSLVMIHHGQEVLNGTVDEVRNSYGRINLTIETSDWAAEDLALLPRVKDVNVLKNNRFLLKLEDEQVAETLFNEITKGRYIPVFNQQAPSLEEIFKYEAGGRSHE